VESVRIIVVTAIKEAISSGFKQKRACEIFDIKVRKYRRWCIPRVKKERKAWNKLQSEEIDIIQNSAFLPELMGKPLCHTFVYGHNTKAFFASMSSVFRYLKEKDLVKPFCPKRRIGKHVSAHDLLDQGFSLLTYDGTAIRTETGVTVWAIPVLLLPCRYLLHVGYSITGVGADDLTKALQEGINFIPEALFGKLRSFSDRGSAMTADKFRNFMIRKMGIPVYYGRPHTPDDEGWIEALNKNIKLHRDAPKIFPIVDDVIAWLPRFKELYNNDPHSSLKYVTPQEAFDGKMEVILAERKQNLLNARQSRLEAYRASMALQVVNR
jgi:hypothetical protein